VHDAHHDDPTTAFAISRLTDAGRLHQAPIGIFRQVSRPTYDDQARGQVQQASAGVTGTPTERLAGLIGGGDTWTVA
jgi:2-oxoglutarate ferredoxin oxidoreductase subunit beta